MSENNIVNSNAEVQESSATAEATATTNLPAQNQPERIVTAHDDSTGPLIKEMLRLQQRRKREVRQVYDNTFVSITDGELVKGLVVGLTKTDVVVNIGFKSDGLVSLNEFRDLQNLKTGDEVEVMVVEKEDREGHLHLSRKQRVLHVHGKRLLKYTRPRKCYRYSYQ